MSNINPQNIDGTFPIAGQDNNSQGFRDNFTGTINNFTRAAAELSDLQTYAVVTGPLTSVGQTGTPTNNMNYTYLTKPQLLGAVETSKNVGNIATSGTIQVDWSQGHYQTVGATGSVSLSFTSTWPTTSLYTKLRLQIKAWGTTTVALDPKVSVNVNSIQGVSANVLTLSDGLYAFEFDTSDAGATISIVDLWRNYDTATQFESLSVVGNILSTGLTVFGNARVGLAGAVSGAFHTVVGNITQVTSGGAVYFNTTGNVSAEVVNTGTLNATGNVLATGLSVFGNARIGLAGVSGGQFHTVVGNITQTSSGGAGTVYINTTGNVLASGVIASTVTTNTLVNNGNIIIQDPINAGSFGSNLTVKGTIEYKTQDQANNFSVNTTTKSLTLAPGGDQFLLLNINANCAIGYNATITQGHQTTVHVKNSAAGLAYVIVPNNNTTIGNAFIGLAAGQVGTFVFTSYNTDAANVMVTVTR